MANEVKWKAPTTRATGLGNSALTAGANLLSSEVDNQANLDRLLALELAWRCTTAATAGSVVEVYILYAVDGTNYEDGGVGVDPFKAPIGVFVDNGGSASQKQTISGIPLAPHKFKVLLKSELDQDASSVTLTAKTYNEDIQ